MAGTGFPVFLAWAMGLRAGALVLEERAFFGAEVLRAAAADLADLAALPLAAAPVADFACEVEALRAGAFSDNERLTIGFGRAVLAPNLRFFAEDAGEF
ncbi:MAG TPA: hypothetical protein VJT09_18145 [Pyrinomonadaceae bacterium]|nr:hypothetical protein [Pyrinomonadaceae bacterium]